MPTRAPAIWSICLSAAQGKPLISKNHGPETLLEHDPGQDVFLDPRDVWSRGKSLLLISEGPGWGSG